MIESPFDFVKIKIHPWIGDPEGSIGGMDVTRAYRLNPGRKEPVTRVEIPDTEIPDTHKGSVRFFRSFISIQAAFNFKESDEDITRQLLEGL